jgi:hypothetical protein
MGMHNGRMGRKIDEQTRERAEHLFKQGLKVNVVAARLVISSSMARNIQREMPKPQDVTSESTESSQWS